MNDQHHIDDQLTGPPTDKLTGHNYDGIQEYDNPMPGWWVWLFHATVAYSVVYMLLVHLSVFDFSVAGAYAADKDRDFKRQWAAIGELEPDAATIARFLKPGNETWLQKGHDIFTSAKAMCATCHGPDGAGLVGPNLTDDRYKNIKHLGDIATVLIQGTGNGTMPSARNQLRLTDNEIVLVAAYVASLRGKNLPTPPTVPAALLGEAAPPWDLSVADEN